jgi:hypothetical protein
MSIKGFNVNGVTEQYDYNSLDNKPEIHSIPTGGTAGQVLAKTSGADYAVVWVNQTGGGGGYSITPEAFGAKGDGVTDDTQALQDCIDFAYQNDIYDVFLPHGKYLISSPLKIYFSYYDFWNGKGITIRGQHQGSTEIVKTGSATYKDVDTVFYCECGDADKTDGSGCSLFDLTISNQSESADAWCIHGANYVRGQFKRLYLKGKNGIYCRSGYCNEFDDIIGYLSGTVLVDGGTSTLVGKIGCFGSHDPYKLNSQYSNYNLLFGDNCTGTFVTVNPYGSCHISVIGTESPNLDCVVELGSAQSTARFRGILIDTINCYNLSTDGAVYIKVKDCTATIENITILYQKEVVQNTLVYFDSTYGYLKLGTFSPITNVTIYDSAKLKFVDNQGGRNILRIDSREENSFKYHDLDILGGSQFYSSIGETERAHNVHSVVMGGVYSGVGQYGDYNEPNGTGTYRYAKMPPAGSLILSDISKSDTGFAGFVSLETGGSYGNLIDNKAPIPILYVGTDANVPQAAKKRGAMLFDTSDSTLKVYYNGAWRSTLADSALSTTSTNPVQNKVVTAAINAKYTKPSGGIPATDLASGVIPSVPSPASSGTPAMDGTAAVGTSTAYARADHVHPSDTSKITAPSSPATGAFLVWNGSAWVAQTLAAWQGGSY